MRRKKKIQIDDLTIALLRTNQRVDDLVKRVKVLEEELNKTKAELNVEVTSNASTLLQEGIDSIMGFQWPPKNGGNE